MARRVETPRLVHDAQLHDAPPGRPRALASLPSRADGGGRRPPRRIARRSRIHRAHHRPSRTPSQARQRLRQTLSRRSDPTSRARRSNQERIRVSRRRRLRRRRARVILRRRPRRSASRSRVALVPRLGGREKGEPVASPPQFFLPIVRDRLVPRLDPSPSRRRRPLAARRPRRILNAILEIHPSGASSHVDRASSSARGRRRERRTRSRLEIRSLPRLGRRARVVKTAFGARAQK